MLVEFSIQLAAGELASLEDEHWSITEAGDGGGGGGAGAGAEAAAALLPLDHRVPLACRSITSAERTFGL